MLEGPAGRGKRASGPHRGGSPPRRAARPAPENPLRYHRAPPPAPDDAGQPARPALPCRTCRIGGGHLSRPRLRAPGRPVPVRLGTPVRLGMEPAAARRGAGHPSSYGGAPGRRRRPAPPRTGTPPRPAKGRDRSSSARHRVGGSGPGALPPTLECTLWTRRDLIVGQRGGAWLRIPPPPHPRTTSCGSTPATAR